MARIVLFDFDGTLADTFESGGALINEFADRFGYKRIDFAANRDLSARQLVKLSGVKLWHIPRLVRFFRKESAKRAEEIKPFEGIVSVVQKLSETCSLGILTTNSASTVERFLANWGMKESFSFVKTEVPLFGKKRALRRAARKLRKNYTDIIYVGDEIRDIEACRKAGIKIISVSWGFNSHTALAQHNALVADTTEQLANLIHQEQANGI